MEFERSRIKGAQNFVMMNLGKIYSSMLQERYILYQPIKNLITGQIKRHCACVRVRVVFGGGGHHAKGKGHAY